MAINSKYAQLQSFTLAGAGVSIGDTSMTLNSFNQINGTPLTMSNFGIKGYGTLEPGSGLNEEQISFTGITSNMDGTVTLTGIDTVLDVFPYTETSAFASDHAGAVTFVISNTAGFYGHFANKLNDETILGLWTFTDATRPALVSDIDATLAPQLITLGQLQRTAIAGGTNATTTVQGFVQLATQTQYDAKTLIGSTGAALVATPDLNRATKYNDGINDTGTANTYTIAPSPAISAYTAYQQFTFVPAHTNTGASTLNVNGLGTKSIVKNVSTALSGGEIVTGVVTTVVYDGTNFQIKSPSTISALGNKLLVVSSNYASGGTSPVAIGSVTVLGGTLNTNNALLITIPWIRVAQSTSATTSFDFIYGATTIGTITLTGNNIVNTTGWMTAILSSAGTTGSQIINIGASIGNTLNFSIYQLATGTAAEDSTANKTLTINATTNNGSGSALQVSGFTIQIIS